MTCIQVDDDTIQMQVFWDKMNCIVHGKPRDIR